ncbi:hypothetical protein DPMN_185891 [Dreissena polymorpha]|uniref:Uncharacterized protein n=1 Tax=Dreissena polymorpha TaxID=45954 RepID=A0A9D4DLW1_DREPO|nr:hypothetical protein DPMN_185891 [Dreissena polymorpha]
MKQDVSTEIYHVTMEQRGITGKVVNMNRGRVDSNISRDHGPDGDSQSETDFLLEAMQLV